MWFDAQKALAEIERGNLSRSLTDAEPAAGIARIARLARPPAANPETAPALEKPADPLEATPDAFAHGQAITGDPRTWTGRVVSLADWRRLSAWDRHGPNGRWFYGDTWQWEPPRGDT